jgi:hypothetical protein
MTEIPGTGFGTDRRALAGVSAERGVGRKVRTADRVAPGGGAFQQRPGRGL